mmetsp:Transcript_22061/g.42048  ORF Transcript_22061/g.42048 Transcript_22061/m.42048 type:complete len:518 (-) Transcript_22061:224-1777(-)|eukprot:CAMPEP_0114285338 /NCGR_PEP_ID=MMETSP0059-20121206/5126_1 /TAXON_ID=36894 /ORGANISM="Pyramimonas parkeae, Strain CCMP726" /LENGTH=517 /DNA_ID=CAMNT_0001406215 /DNA_START=235 /DNA_END=1788 /DNA_ORIENTATION=-
MVSSNDHVNGHGLPADESKPRTCSTSAAAAGDESKACESGSKLLTDSSTAGQPGMSTHADSITGNEQGRKISALDIQLVQNLIERCLQLYMTRKDVVSSLQLQAKIEPGFTSLVWQKLEEQNPDFFKAYYTRLKVKDQIELFNTMLEYHVQVLQKTRAGVGTAAGVSGAAPMAVPAANLMHGPPHMQNGHVMAPMQYPGMQQQMSHLAPSQGVPVNGMMMQSNPHSGYPHMSMEQQYMAGMPPQAQQGQVMHMQGMHGHPAGLATPYGHAQMYGSMAPPEYQHFVPHAGAPGMHPHGMQAHPMAGPSGQGHPHTQHMQFQQPHPLHQQPHPAQQHHPHHMQSTSQQQPNIHPSHSQVAISNSNLAMQQHPTQTMEAGANFTPQHTAGSQPPPGTSTPQGTPNAGNLNNGLQLESPGTMMTAAGGDSGMGQYSTPVGSALHADGPDNSLFSHLPRNFSLTDLSLELSHQLNDAPGESPLALFVSTGLDALGSIEDSNKSYRLPRNFSLSDMTLDFDQT